MWVRGAVGEPHWLARLAWAVARKERPRKESGPLVGERAHSEPPDVPRVRGVTLSVSSWINPWLCCQSDGALGKPASVTQV